MKPLLGLCALVTLARDEKVCVLMKNPSRVIDTLSSRLRMVWRILRIRRRLYASGLARCCGCFMLLLDASHSQKPENMASKNKSYKFGRIADTAHFQRRACQEGSNEDLGHQGDVGHVSRVHV